MPHCRYLTCVALLCSYIAFAPAADGAEPPPEARADSPARTGAAPRDVRKPKPTPKEPPAKPPANNSRERELALKYGAITDIKNRSNSKTEFLIRWRRWNGSWTDWKKYELQPHKSSLYWWLGASGGEIRFDRYANDGKVTEWTVSLSVTRALSAQDVRKSIPNVWPSTSKARPCGSTK